MDGGKVVTMSLLFLFYGIPFAFVVLLPGIRWVIKRHRNIHCSISWHFLSEEAKQEINYIEMKKQIVISKSHDRLPQIYKNLLDRDDYNRGNDKGLKNG